MILTSEYLGPNPSPSRPPQRSFHHDPQDQSQSLISRKTFQAWHLHPLNWWSYDNWQVGRRTEFKPQLCTPEVISTTVWAALEPVSIGIRAELRKSKRLLSRCEAGLGFGSVHLWRIVGFNYTPKNVSRHECENVTTKMPFNNNFNKRYIHIIHHAKKRKPTLITLWSFNIALKKWPWFIVSFPIFIAWWCSKLLCKRLPEGNHHWPTTPLIQALHPSLAWPVILVGSWLQLAKKTTSDRHT